MVIYGGVQLTPTSTTTDLQPDNEAAQPMKELTVGDVWAFDFDTNMWECMSIAPHQEPDKGDDGVNTDGHHVDTDQYMHHPSIQTSHAAMEFNLLSLEDGNKYTVATTINPFHHCIIYVKQKHQHHLKIHRRQE